MGGQPNMPAHENGTSIMLFQVNRKGMDGGLPTWIKITFNEYRITQTTISPFHNELISLA